eukprot:152766-Hanusia_phi.AAC.1
MVVSREAEAAEGATVPCTRGSEDDPEETGAGTPTFSVQANAAEEDVVPSAQATQADALVTAE